MRIYRCGVAEVERRADDPWLCGNGKLATPKRSWRARRIRVLSGIEGIVAASAARNLWRLDDRCRCCDLRLPIGRLALDISRRSLRLSVSRLHLRLSVSRARRLLAVSRSGLRGRRRSSAGLGGSDRGTGRHTPLSLLEPLLEQAVLVLQFLVLAGKLPELVLKLLDPHLRIVRTIRLSLRK